MRGRVSPARPDGAGYVRPVASTITATRTAPSASCIVASRATAAPEQVILDENRLAAGRRGFSLDETTISPDHKLLAYSVDEDGSERSVLKIRDLATGRDLADSLGEVRGDFVWSADGQWLFYVRRDPVKWGRTVYRHKLGTPVADDLIVHEESEEGFTVSLRSTLSDRFLVIEFERFFHHRPQGPRPHGTGKPALRRHRARAGSQVGGLRPRRPADLRHQCRRRHRLEDRREGPACARRARRCAKSCRIVRAA